MVQRLPVLAVAAVTVVAAASGVAPAAPAAAASWEQEVAALVATRARAVREGDEAAFLGTVAGAPEPFVRRQRAWFRRLRALPVAGYALELERDGFGDLAPALRDPPPGEVHVVGVRERLRFRGYDEAPAAATHWFTVARAADGWRIVADDDLEDLGLRSSRELWDFGPVEATGDGTVLVLHHPDRGADARAVLSETRRAAARVTEAWPLPWSGKVVVVLPADVEALERILQTTFDLGPFIAFAVSSIDRSEGWRLTGPRVYAQPRQFFAAGSGRRREVLGHEVLHIATRDLSSPWTPNWLEEGVAQVYGEEAPGARAALAGRVRRGTFDGRLPGDWIFVVGDREDIAVAYQSSEDVVAWMRRAFGDGAPPRLYEALGTARRIAPGTWRYHLDRAVRETLGIPYRDLERRWAARANAAYS